jgi:hypothetical protein
LESRKELFKAFDELRRETAEPPVEVVETEGCVDGPYDVTLNGEVWASEIPDLDDAEVIADALRDKWRKGEV